MYHCEICNLNFKRINNLNRHLDSKKHFLTIKKQEEEEARKIEEAKEAEKAEEERKIREAEEAEEAEKIKQRKKMKFLNYHCCELCNKKYKLEIRYHKHLLSEEHKHKRYIEENKNVRVAVINIKTMKIKYGKNAPFIYKLEEFLKKNSDYEVYDKNLHGDMIIKNRQEIRRKEIEKEKITDSRIKDLEIENKKLIEIKKELKNVVGNLVKKLDEITKTLDNFFEEKEEEKKEE